MIDFILGAGILGSLAYAAYKHLTVADVKKELLKIEGEIANGVLAAEVKAGYAAIVARIKALL